MERFRKSGLVAAMGVFGILSAFAFASESSQPKPTSPRKIKWLIAHEPADVFRRAAVTFNDLLMKETQGALALEVLSPKDIGWKGENVPYSAVFKLLAEHKVDMSQTVTSGIGEMQKEFWAFDLPFLFKNHEHASRVLEGKVGQRLLASLESHKLHGLAFTYSGGFRVIPSFERELHSAADFKGLRVRTNNSPVAHEILKTLGATPVGLSVDGTRDAFASKKVDAAETTYVRFESVGAGESKVVNETHHSLFLTTILASDEFMKSLSPEHRDALRRAAVQAARIERADSLSDGEAVKKQLQAKGVRFVRMSDAELKDFEKKVKPVYSKFEKMLGKDLIHEIEVAAAH